MIAKYQEKNTFLFPPNLIPERPAVQVKRGDRVQIRERKDLGKGMVVDLEPDGRLVKCRFYGRDGWWSKFDLIKV